MWRRRCMALADGWIRNRNCFLYCAGSTPPTLSPPDSAFHRADPLIRSVPTTSPHGGDDLEIGQPQFAHQPLPRFKIGTDDEQAKRRPQTSERKVAKIPRLPGDGKSDHNGPLQSRSAHRSRYTSTRTLANLSPAAFAKALNISAVTLQRWEESKGTLTLRSASRHGLMVFQEALLRKLQ